MRMNSHPLISTLSLVAASCCLLLTSQSAVAQLRIVSYNTATDTNGEVPRTGMADVLQAIGIETKNGIQRPIDVLSIQETGTGYVGSKHRQSAEWHLRRRHLRAFQHFGTWHVDRRHDRSGHLQHQHRATDRPGESRHGQRGRFSASSVAIRIPSRGLRLELRLLHLLRALQSRQHLDRSVPAFSRSGSGAVRLRFAGTRHADHLFGRLQHSKRQRDDVPDLDGRRKRPGGRSHQRARHLAQQRRIRRDPHASAASRAIQRAVRRRYGRPL